MRLSRFLAALPALVCLAAAPIGAQAPQPTPAPPLSQQQINEEMLRELRSIRMLLERLTTPQQQQAPPPQPTTAKLTNLKGYVLGKPDAPLTMIEFTDLQCPFCRQFASTTFEEIRKNWIDTGKLRFISRDFPLDFHAMAMPAARAARCAGEQGKYWEMRLALVKNANMLSADFITKTAADLKLNTRDFAGCAAQTRYDAEIQAEMQEGAKIGVNGTPGFVLGKTNSTALEGPLVIGAQPYAVFDAKLKELFAQTAK